MTNFDLQRFGRVLRLDFAQSRSILLWFTLGGLMLYLFFFWFAYNIGMKVSEVNDWEGYIRSVCEGVAMSSTVSMYFFFLAAASTLYWAEQKKAKRTAHLMLPATNLEKFLARWVYLLVFSVVGGLLTFFVADGVHLVFLWLTDKPVAAATSFFLNNLSEGGKVDSLSFYSILLAGHAFFLLGGVLFRKFHFVFSAIVGVVLLTTLMHFLTLDQPYMRFVPFVWWHAGMTVLFTFFTCLFTWLAYRIYCRWQVVTRNFVNLP